MNNKNFNPYNIDQFSWLYDIYCKASYKRKVSILENAMELLSLYNGQPVTVAVVRSTFEYLTVKETREFKKLINAS